MSRWNTTSLPTCEGCPLVNVIISDIDVLGEMSFSKNEIGAASEAMAAKTMSLMNISNFARAIDCPSQSKEIPPEPVPMPPVGHPDRIAYGQHCLAYLAMRKASGNPIVEN